MNAEVVSRDSSCPPRSAKPQLRARSRRGRLAVLHRCLAGRVRRTAGLVLLASLAAPLLGAGGSAEAQLVSNFNSATSTSVRLGATTDSKDVVQVFTTGTNTGGYTLTSINLHFWRDGGTQGVPTVTLHNVTVSSASVTLGTAVATLTASSVNLEDSERPLAYTAPTGTSLIASTTYGVYAHSGHDDAYWALTTTGDENPTPAVGWSIGDQAATRAHDATGAFTVGTAGSGQITVNGTAKGNTAATGAPGITGTTTVGETLTATVGDIADANGLPDPLLTDANTTFQWVREDPVSNGRTNISGATASTYTLVREDWLHRVEVQVSFQDNQGNSEGPLASSLVPSSGFSIEAPQNTPATGKPGITGTTTEGQTLTATVGTIADANGFLGPLISDASTTVQWIRVATDSSEADIPNALDTTYTLITADVGNTIKVKVSFHDYFNALEGPFTSAATAVVSAANTAPTTTGGSVTTPEDTPYTFTAADFNFSDTDLGDALESVIVTSVPNVDVGTVNVDGTPIVPANLPRTVGKADIDAGNLTYAPPSNTSGSASFTFQVNDGEANSTSGIMTVTTTAVNDAPTVATVIPDRMATAGTLFSYQFPATTFTDVDTGDTLSYAAAKPDDSALPAWLTFTAASRTFSGTPMAADTGMVSVKVTASDGNGGSASDTFAIMVRTTPNTAPTTTGGSVTTPEDTPYTFTAADFNFSDTDLGDALESVIVTSVPNVDVGTVNVDGTPIVPANLPRTVGKADIDAGNLTYAPPSNTSGSASFTFQVNDGEANSTSGIMTVTTTAVNDAPTVATVIPDRMATAGTLFSYQFPATTFTDVDTGDTLSYAAAKSDDSALPAWLTFTAASRTFSGTPMAADTGMISVKVTASDGNGGSASDEFDITVRNPNAGICGRTAAVQTVILAKIAGVTACADVTTSHLAAITGTLDLDQTSITALAAGDFDGLTALTGLSMWDNGLTELPAGLFDGLTAVEFLDLEDNALTELPAGIFDDLAAVVFLDLEGNSLAALPPGVFDNLTGLTQLKLGDNSLDVLPGNVFEPLTALTDLQLQGNPGAPFEPVAMALPDDGTVSGAGGTVMLDGSGSGGAWGANVTYSWALTTPASGVTVTFDNTMSATPTVTIPALTAGTELTFTLTVTGRGGSRGISPGTATAKVTVPATVPGAPTSLSATAGGSTRINLSWNAPASDGGASISGYRIEVSPNGTSSWTNRVGNTGSTSTSYAHTGLSAGTTRHYRVSAINSVGTGTASNVDDATTDDDAATVPGAPTSLSATAGGSTRINLTWNAPASTGGASISGYRIEVSPNGTSSWTNRVGNTGSTSTSYAHTGLSAGTTRHYRVSAINSVGTGTASNVDDATTDDDAATVPGAPTGLSATAGGSTRINLTWNAPASTGGASISGYRIEVSPNGTSSWTNRVGNTGSTSTSYAHTGLSAGTTRHYRVSAINSVGTGTASNVDDATTDDDAATVPGAPTSLSATAGGSTRINLTWNAPASTGGASISGYRIEVSPNGTSSWTNRVGNTGSTSTSYAHTGLSAGTTRHYRVSAINSVGTGTASNVDDATTDDDAATVPGAPTGLSATAGGSTRINLTWNAPASTGGASISGYTIEVSPNGTSSWTNRVGNTGSTSTSYSHTGLSAGTTRHYRVSAINSVGTGTASNVDDATTDDDAATVPGAPTSLSATAGGSTRINLTWNAPASTGGASISGYTIEVSPNGTSSWTNRVGNTGSTSTSYSHTGLSAGTTRHYRVSAINSVGTGTASNVDDATTDSDVDPITRPSAPERLTATADDGEVFLEWTAPADDGGSFVTDYEYRYAAGDRVPANTPWRSAGRTLEGTVTGLINGQQYAFEVRAWNDAGPGARAQAVATPLGVPGAPEPLTATAGDGEVLLGWTAPAADGGTPVTGYEYRYAADDEVPADTPWRSAGLSLERTVAALTRGQQYVFEVRARNRVGPGAPAKAVATPLGVPSAPQRLTATPGDGEVLLEWTAPADDGGAPVTGYQYRYAAGAAVPEGRRWRSAGKALERTVTGLTNGRLYAFEVRARNRVGGGRVRTARAIPVGVPGAPASLTATAGDGEVALTWRAPADNGGTPVTGYEYRHAAGAAVPEGTPWQSAGLLHELTVTGLTNGQQYAFEVRARNRVGEGEPTGALATPVGRPGAPASLAAMAGDKAVALLWSAPVDDGGTPVTGYEYRYAAGGAVPDGTPWQFAGLTLLSTVTGLTNGQSYAFEVRAVNRVGGGEARGVLATPLGRPGAPASLTATGGDGEVALAWSAPADDGGTPVTGYEYRHAAGDAVPGETPWQEADAEGTATVTGLENETRYAFEVRALNRVGPGEASRTTALPLRLRAELFSSGAAAEGEALVIGVRRSGGLAFEAHATIGVTDNALPGMSATQEGRGDGLGRHRLEFAAGEAEATVTVTIAFDGERRQDRVLTATLDSAAAKVDGVARAYEPVAPTLVVPVTEGDAGLSVADTRVQGKSAVLAFTVSMDRTRDVAVRVNYATGDGSARAGEDYMPVAGTLTIQPGGREGTVEVPVLEALHVTGERTLTLTLSNAGNAVIDDGMATGTIARTSELPKAWLARFGRTASDHAAQAIGRRVLAGERETHVTVAGRRMDGLVGQLRSGGGGLLASTARNMAGSARSGLAAAAARSADPDGRGAEESAETLRRAVLPGVGFKLPEVQDALLGSSFHVQGGAQQAEGGGGAWAVWGDVATTHFEGDANGLGLNGDVTTGTVGLDREWRKLLVGLALARSGGDGAYGRGAGTITSTLTSVHPYLRYRLAERAQLWGAMGWGRGGMRLTPGRGAAIETDLTNAMAALGGRAVLRRAGGESESSIEIALRSDLLWTSTSSDRAGVLAEATGRASRGRLMLEGAGRISGLGGVLRHSVEGGLRYDGGDAETGAGLEVGTGLDWARGGLVLSVNGRMLLAYADDSYEEWGYGGSLIYESGAADGRGLRMRLGSTTGAMASGVRSLWTLENASGLVRGGGMPFKQRFDAEVGFGLGGGALWYPYLAADAMGQKRLGLRLSSGQSLDVGLEFGRTGDRTRSAKDALVLRGDIRF